VALAGEKDISKAVGGGGDRGADGNRQQHNHTGDLPFLEQCG
jgi:hypothetical protein